MSATQQRTAEATAIPNDLPEVSSLVLDLLAWVASSPRTYLETLDAWRTSCPRLSVWEDAMDAGLVQVECGSGPLRETMVGVTPRGQELLNARR